MTDNLRIWNALGKTDPRHTKPFSRAGGFKGTATKPIWTTMRMTEHFGPCGFGWGMTKPEFQVVSAGDEVLVYCTVGLWYQEQVDALAARRCEVFGVGGDKSVTKRNDGKLFADDEAFKKAYTDAIGNAMKQIGVAADVHMGLFDDSKYVSEMRQEFAADDARPAAPPPQRAVVAWDRFHSDALKQLAGKSQPQCRDWWKQNLATLGEMQKNAPDLWKGLKDFCATAGHDVRMAG